MKFQEALTKLIEVEKDNPGKSTFVIFREDEGGHDVEDKQIRIVSMSRDLTCFRFEQRLGGHNHSGCQCWNSWNGTPLHLSLDDINGNDWKMIEMNGEEIMNGDDIKDVLTRMFKVMASDIEAKEKSNSKKKSH